MVNTPPLLIAAVYLSLLFAVIGLWISRWAWIGALTIAVILGYVSGVLYGPAVLWVVALAGLCLGFERAKGISSRASRIALVSLSAAGLLALGVLLAMHVLPGFHNFLVLDHVVFSEGAEPFTLYLNFDKTLVGICILGLCNRSLLARASKWAQALRRAAPIVPVHVALVAAVACAIGYLTWQPKWTPLFWIWAPVNLFFVCLAEEAVFRGFIQRELTLALRGVRAGSAIAIAVGAVLFGLAHFAGGMSYVALATAAGLGYGIVYHRAQSIEMAMLSHFALNTVHFLLFTYPRHL
jgi:membrane protease YdiL (CAAX protease family)